MESDLPVPLVRRPAPAPWRILVVDDAEDVFHSTRMSLKDLTVEDRGVELVYAGSGAAAMERLSRERDFAVVFLDVVMERDHSGLSVAHWIRETAGLDSLQIVLRTGQAGKAPEDEVAKRYEIHAYIEKTEAVRQKLRTVASTAIRAHRTLETLKASRTTMETLARATRALIGRGSPGGTAEAGLAFLLEMVDRGGVHGRSGFAIMQSDFGDALVAAEGVFRRPPRGKGDLGAPETADIAWIEANLLDAEDRERLHEALVSSGVQCTDTGVWMSMQRDDALRLVFYARSDGLVAGLGRDVLELIAGTLGDAANKIVAPQAAE